jgi:pantothenate kinase
MVIAICGPIASGKSTAARAVAQIFGREGSAAAAVDLDLLYELHEHDGAIASRGRRARVGAASLTDSLLENGVDVVIAEGDFLTADERAEFATAIRSPVELRYVTVHAPLDVALERVRLDPTRGGSRDPDFVRRHYAEVADAVADRPAADLVIDTSAVGIEETARTIVDWAAGRLGSGEPEPLQG